MKRRFAQGKFDPAEAGRIAATVPKIARTGQHEERKAIAQERAKNRARESSLKVGNRLHTCACGRVLKGNVAWGTHRKLCAVLREQQREGGDS